MSEVFLKKGEKITLIVETLESHPSEITYDDAYGFSLTKMNNEFGLAMQKKRDEAAAEQKAEADKKAAAEAAAAAVAAGAVGQACNVAANANPAPATGTLAPGAAA